MNSVAQKPERARHRRCIHLSPGSTTRPRSPRSDSWIRNTGRSDCSSLPHTGNAGNSSIHHGFSGRATQTIARAVKASAGKSLSGKFRKPAHRIRPGSRRATAGDAEMPKTQSRPPEFGKAGCQHRSDHGKDEGVEQLRRGGERPVEPVGDPREARRRSTAAGTRALYFQKFKSEKSP